MIEVCWVAPPDGCSKINVDESHFSKSGSSACGELATDSCGKFVKGFYRFGQSCGLSD